MLEVLTGSFARKLLTQGTISEARVLANQHDEVAMDTESLAADVIEELVRTYDL